MIDGKKQYRSAKSIKDLKEKVKKIADLPVSSGKYKTDEWMQLWLSTYIEPLRKPATYNQYKILYEKHIKDAIGYRKLTGVTSPDIQAIIATMNRAGLSTWTMKHVRKILHIAFEKALEQKLVSENPVYKIDIPKRQPKPKRVFTAFELCRLFDVMKDSRWLYSVQFLLYTALRRGELLGLKWSDVNINDRHILIHEAETTTGPGDTKPARDHYIPLSDQAIECLNNQKDMLMHEYNPIMYNSTPEDKKYVFPARNGQAITPDCYRKTISNYAAKAGFKASPHAFRHTFVYLNRNRLTLKQLQDALGHDESTTTLDIYGNILDRGDDTVAANMTSVFNDLQKNMSKYQDAGIVVNYENTNKKPTKANKK